LSIRILIGAIPTFRWLAWPALTRCITLSGLSGISRFVPARHALGAVLLRDKRAEAAEKVYREDLRRWPDNGWALHGLARTLDALGRKAEAAAVDERFKEVWKRADVKIKSLCFCVEE
jgi:hypothetical protein